MHHSKLNMVTSKGRGGDKDYAARNSTILDGIHILASISFYVYPHRQKSTVVHTLEPRNLKACPSMFEQDTGQSWDLASPHNALKG